MIPRARVNISQYPYGRIRACVRRAAEWINSHNREIRSSELEQFLPTRFYKQLRCEEAYFLGDQTAARRMHFWHNPD